MANLETGNGTGAPPRVFLSYNRNRTSWVQRVATQWRSLGLRVFFDVDSVNPGEPVVGALEREITGCDHVVLMLSPAALASPWVAMEVAMTRTSDPSGNSRKLIPVIVEPMDMDSIGPAIRCLGIVDLTQPEQQAQQYHHLLRSLGLEGPSLPEMPPFDDAAEPAGESAEGADAGEAGRTVGIELTIEGDLERFTHQQQSQLMAGIMSILGTGEELRIRHLRKGSILLTLDLSPSQAEQLYQAVRRGELHELGVRGARLLTANDDAEGVREESSPSAARRPSGSAGARSGLAPEAILLEHLGWINRIAATTCRRHGIWGDEADDFAAWVTMKIIENDYAVLRKFRGESDLRTYLATAVVRQYHEYSRGRWGRWRPSSAAERLGTPARELEALVYRDGYVIAQAGEKLRTSGITTLSDRELALLLTQLPPRARLRPVKVDADPVLGAAVSSLRADEHVVTAESEARRNEVMTALNRAMEKLQPEDRLIVRMHYADGRTLAYVARALHLDQKPLYRRVHRLQQQLREYLETEGISTYTDPEDLAAESLPEGWGTQPGAAGDEPVGEKKDVPAAEVGVEVPTSAASETGAQLESSPPATEAERHSLIADALIRAIAHLTPEEQKIVGMHFEGRTLEQMASALRLKPKWLFRKIERLRERLKSSMEDDGAWVSEIREAFWDEDAA